MLTGDTHEAEAAEDGVLEASDAGEGGVNVRSRTGGTSRVQPDLQRSSPMTLSGCLVAGGGSATFGDLGGAAEAAGTADECGGFVDEDDITRGVLGLGAVTTTAAAPLSATSRREG